MKYKEYLHAKITENFTYAEFLRSSALDKWNSNEKRKNKDHIIIYNEIVLESHHQNLRRLCEQLEVIRRYAKCFLKVNSGYRNNLVNNLVDGKNNSLHTIGCAVDVMPDLVFMSVKKLYELILFLQKKGEIMLDQVIYYPPMNFIHLQVSRKIEIMPRGWFGIDNGDGKGAILQEIVAFSGQRKSKK